MNVIAANASAKAWGLSSGAVELLKWLAFAAMLVDHVNTVLFDRQYAWAFAVGRFAMPVFALVLAYNMARPGVDLRTMQNRLLLWGVAVQPLVVATINRGEWLPLNVLLTFAVGVYVVRSIQAGWSLLPGLLFTAAAALVDYSIVGPLLVASGYWWFTTRKPAALVVCGLVVAGLCGLNGNGWALCGILAVVAAACVSPRLPHVRWLFLAGYPLHLGVLAFLALR